MSQRHYGYAAANPYLVELVCLRELDPQIGWRGHWRQEDAEAPRSRQGRPQPSETRTKNLGASEIEDLALLVLQRAHLQLLGLT
jgi:hypothetical protein